jgi:hypothetical protein
MMTNGLYPISEGLVSIFLFDEILQRLFFLGWHRPPLFSVAVSAEIDFKFGPCDIAKLPIWCDDILPFIALIFPVHVPSLPN